LTTFEDGASPRERGREGEDEAVAWLLFKGYEVVERNIETNAGEIDLVAREGDTLCFVEIKARSTAEFGPAIAAVDRRKQSRILRAASLYLAMKDLDEVACRFDVVGMDWDPATTAWRFTLIRDAFQAA